MIKIHLLFMSLMFVLIFTSFLFILYGKRKRVIIHKILSILGISSGVVGIIIMIIFKIQNSYPHLKSSHSIFGVTGFLFLLSNSISGYLITKGKIKLKILHKITGFTGILLSLIAVITGLIRNLF